ncbi:MAG: dihydrolipoamide acyltransferase [Alphaproteobacteria bacterium]|uniref:lipoyl domain-containing protein n=1 Tax=Sandarakinorhabdus sp. DWP1-3-1 TaxID=2804627 RepID=UPI000DB5887B|nr:MAG: dihydrolipoamide acyltransferase [Alphaproteobacteria bacterium]
MTDIQIPKLGMSMTEATLTEWLFADGAEVTEGVDLYLIETDKSTTEIQAPASGRLSIIAAAGEVYPVGELIARIE